MADPTPQIVYIVTSEDIDGDHGVERVFANEADAQAYADQFTPLPHGPAATVMALPVETTVPTRYTNYFVTQMFPRIHSAAKGDTAQYQDGPFRPRVYQFDAGEEHNDPDSGFMPQVTEPALTDHVRRHDGWQIVRAYGTDEDAVIAAFRQALAENAVHARQRLAEIREG